MLCNVFGAWHTVATNTAECSGLEHPLECSDPSTALLPARCAVGVASERQVGVRTRQHRERAAVRLCGRLEAGLAVRLIAALLEGERLPVWRDERRQLLALPQLAHARAPQLAVHVAARRRHEQRRQVDDACGLQRRSELFGQARALQKRANAVVVPLLRLRRRGRRAPRHRPLLLPGRRRRRRLNRAPDLLHLQRVVEDPLEGLLLLCAHHHERVVVHLVELLVVRAREVVLAVEKVGARQVLDLLDVVVFWLELDGLSEQVRGRSRLLLLVQKVDALLARRDEALLLLQPEQLLFLALFLERVGVLLELLLLLLELLLGQPDLLDVAHVRHVPRFF
mmetsp:Transcript_39851/g.129011  ORF Transcript_39851/g.129011 Transcript_39851/m.129011 type:complete len:338 (-) Transcript_39851:49-1062(-)